MGAVLGAVVLAVVGVEERAQARVDREDDGSTVPAGAGRTATICAGAAGPAHPSVAV